MSNQTVEAIGRVAGVRWVALDAFRGLAILAMMLDHVMLVTGGPFVVRATIGRLAMPMFFLLAGYLASRPRGRHIAVGLLGLALPVLVPWLDSPNVLILWGLGVVLLWYASRLGIPAWVLVGCALVLFANDWGQLPGAYPPFALWGFMALGSMIPRAAFEWARLAPRWVAAIGRRPLWWYAGHALALQAVVLVVAP